MNTTYSIAEQYTRFPGPRYEEQGPHSGQAFLRDVLVPLLGSSDEITLDLDGAVGYGSSFLEETFGGLIRTKILTVQEFENRIKLKSSSDTLVREIEGYINNAQYHY